MAVLFYCAGKVKFVEVEKELNKKQIGKRLLQVLIVLFGISFLTFGLTLSPGDPAEIMLTECGNLPTPELLAKTRAELGLDKPFLVQYGNWLKGVVTGDMGTSYSFKVPGDRQAGQLLLAPRWSWPCCPWPIMILVSVPLGILAAVHQNKWCDYMVRALTFLGVSIPSFWIGLILLRSLALTCAGYRCPADRRILSPMIMPAITLAISMSAKYTRQVRIAVFG